jgi:D-lactate dehydrogenase
VSLLAPDVSRIAPQEPQPASDRAPDWVAGGTPEPLRSELIELLGPDRVLARGSTSSATPPTRARTA